MPFWAKRGCLKNNQILRNWLIYPYGQGANKPLGADKRSAKWVNRRCPRQASKEQGRAFASSLGIVMDVERHANVTLQRAWMNLNKYRQILVETLFNRYGFRYEIKRMPFRSPMLTFYCCRFKPVRLPNPCYSCMSLLLTSVYFFVLTFYRDFLNFQEVGLNSF